jgi:hypothetical protein
MGGAAGCVLMLGLFAASDRSVVDQLAPYLGVVVGLIALAGVWVGKRLEQRNAKAGWLLDRCLERYAELLAASNDLLEALMAAFEQPDVAEGPAGDLKRREQAWNRAFVVVELLGPQEIETALHRYSDAHAALLELCESTDELAAARAVYGRLLSTRAGEEWIDADMRLRGALSDVIR